MDGFKQKKIKFARALARDVSNPFIAAISVFPDEPSTAIRAATEWINDSFVTNVLEDIKNAKEEDLLPSKFDLALYIWERMQNNLWIEEHVKLAKLYADVMGFIEKPENTTSLQITNNKVMVIKDQGDNEKWEKALREQQEMIVSEQ